jgi:hypothetical protein
MSILQEENVRFTSAEALLKWWANNWGDVTVGELQMVGSKLNSKERQRLAIMVQALSKGLGLKKGGIKI